MKPKNQERIIIIRDAAIAYNLGKLNTTQFMQLVETVIREQDRDTRHACAEAVFALPFEEGTMISASRAHAACMNTQAV